MNALRRHARYSFRMLAPAVLLIAGACAGFDTSAIDPSEVLTVEDEQRRERAVQQALENVPTGQGVNWENPGTGHRGSVAAVRTYKSDAGENCRVYQETITAEDTTETEVHGACRRADGLWRATAGARANAREYAIANGFVRDNYYYPHYDYWGRPYFGYGYYPDPYWGSFYYGRGW